MINPIERLTSLSQNLQNVNISILQKHFDSIQKLLSRKEKYQQLCILCRNKGYLHPEWLLLAGQIKIAMLKESLPVTFSDSTKMLKPILNKDYYDFVIHHSTFLDSLIEDKFDYRYNIFSIETLLKSYLARFKDNGKTTILETPQYMYLRVATFLWFEKEAVTTSSDEPKCYSNIKKIFYDMIQGKYTHASPTLFNAGLTRSQLGSCFIMNIDDNIGSISDSWKYCAIISKNSGGIGINFSDLRHSEIGHYGESSGIVNWIRITDRILTSVDQGGKRKGSGTVYLNIYHIDIEASLDLRKNTGSEELRARDLFYALWIPDEFMRRVEVDGNWTLFCPNKVKGLTKKWGPDFEMAYKAAEIRVQKGKLSNYRIVNARELWKKIVLTQIETGMPFMLYADACNRKSNQSNLGTITTSNLCTEILEYTDSDNIASCNLGSLALNYFVKSYIDKGKVKYKYDFKGLEEATRQLCRNINQVIDRNYYPSKIPQIKNCNLRNRPMGIGVQGLADTFAIMDITWTSNDAKKLNEMIFETIYYAAVSECIVLSKLHGPYETFRGSPASKGLFQFDLWDLEKIDKELENKLEISLESLQKYSKENRRGPTTDRYNWETLRNDMMKYGLRNSLLIALMPTASSAQILGNNECFEPFHSAIGTRTVLSGQFIVPNKHLVRDLQNIGMWTTNVVKNIISNSGSIQKVPLEWVKDKVSCERLKFLKEKYLTVFEISGKILLDMSADRGRYVCQTQSLNCFMKEPSYKKLTAYHFYGWKRGLKTGMYYLKQQAITNPINFSLNSINIPKKLNSKNTSQVCRIDDQGCVSCSS